MASSDDDLDKDYAEIIDLLRWSTKVIPTDCLRFARYVRQQLDKACDEESGKEEQTGA